MKFPAWVEIDLDALGHNVQALRALVGRETKICLVVKADAYGHGAVEVARAALGAGVDMLGVATLHEGIELRRANVSSPMLVLSPSLPTEIEELIEYRLRPSVSSLTFARELSRASQEQSTVTPFHVEVDTGMGRTGLDYESAYETLRELSQLPAVTVEGVYTHFPDADNPDLSFARMQVKMFSSLLVRLKEEGICFELIHAANSAGMVNLPESLLNMVRPGLLAYGLRPGGEATTGCDVRPVMSFKSCVVQLRRVQAGSYISYGRTCRVAKDSVIAVVPVGYGHGYSWTLSNSGEMLVRGRRAPIVGRVTMDLTMLDVTHVPDVTEGDEVVLFGRQGEEQITVDEVARKAGTLSYEILCSIGKRVVRTFLLDNRPSKVLTLVGERKEVRPTEGNKCQQPVVQYLSVPAITDERG
ncbi:MAG: alanine racemase [Candidatus Eiseniibacteriota bacterium]|nr:MAG: alanine racemase [Candidatus Eisenbacteria bacterium]